MTGADLVAELGVARGDFSLAAELAVAAGEVVALVGPNGAGKTTVLQALCGLLPLTSGRIAMGSAIWDDAAADTFIPPAARSVGAVFQDYALFPNLTALENVAFGPRARGTAKQAARTLARQLLGDMGLAAFADARPAALSGGQRQRVALARALATSPTLLIFDEPLAALDPATRGEVRGELRRHLSQFAGAAVVITHDVLDAMVLADRIVVLEGGRVVQVGAAGQVARAPRTDYVARFMGLNLVRGVASGTAVAVAGGGEINLARPAVGDVFVAFAPAAVALHRAPVSGGSPRNVWRGQVDGVERHAETVRVTVSGAFGQAGPQLIAEVTAAAVHDLQLVPGTQVWVTLKATEVTAYPASG